MQASVSVGVAKDAPDQNEVPYNATQPRDPSAFHGQNSLHVTISNQAAVPDTLGIPGTGQPGSPVYHGGAGARNRGLGNEGFHLLAGKDYEGYLYAIAPAPPPPQPGAPPPPPPLLEVSLEGDGQRILAAQRFVVSRANWTKLSFSLTPNETTSCSSGAGDPSVYCGTYEGLPSPGHACVKCGGGLKLRVLAGSMSIDFVMLMPGAWGRLHDKSGKPLPVLKSGADALRQMGTKAIRQGGSFVCDSGTGRNGNTPANASYYEWQKWTGLPEFRPSVGAHWVNSLISGWGPFEMIDLCNALDIEPIVSLTRIQSPSDMADFVEYLHGDGTTPMGKQRAADGHPAKYEGYWFELGNEQTVPLFGSQVPTPPNISVDPVTFPINRLICRSR